MSTPSPSCPPNTRPVGGMCLNEFGMNVGRAIICPPGYVFAEPTIWWGKGTCKVDPAVEAEQQQRTASATAVAQAAVDRYTMSFNALQIQKNQLQQTADLMESAKGLYSGVSDDLHSSVNQFTQQISDIQNQINITNRKSPEPKWWPWLDMFLNIMIVLTLLYAIYVVVSKVMFVRPVVQQVQYAY